LTEFPHASLCYLTEPTPGQPVINVQTPDGKLTRAIVNHDQLKQLIARGAEIEYGYVEARA
jgi:hypothetical protein